MLKELRHWLVLLTDVKSKMITVYTKDNCPACVSLKATLTQEGKPFKEINIGRDITREAFMSKFPHVRTVPFKVTEGETA